MLWGLSLVCTPKAAEEAACSALLPQSQRAGARLSVGVRGAGAPGAAAQTWRTDGVRSLLSLGTAAGRIPSVCLPLEEEAELTSVFQAGSQAGIIFMFPV